MPPFAIGVTAEVSEATDDARTVYVALAVLRIKKVYSSTVFNLPTVGAVPCQTGVTVVPSICITLG